MLLGGPSGCGPGTAGNVVCQAALPNTLEYKAPRQEAGPGL